MICFKKWSEEKPKKKPRERSRTQTHPHKSRLTLRIISSHWDYMHDPKNKHTTPLHLNLMWIEISKAQQKDPSALRDACRTQSRSRGGRSRKRGYKWEKAALCVVSGGKGRMRSSNMVCLHAAAHRHMLHLLSEEGQLIQEESTFSISTRAPGGRRL